MEHELIETLIQLYERDLSKLKEELKLYEDEASIWKVDGGIKNSAGNLTLHICGNLQHYIGAVLGGSGYERNRELEFSSKNLLQSELIELVRKTKLIVISTLKGLDTELLKKTYPEKVFEKPMTTTFFLVHLAGHLNYHFGQINYHRRLIDTVVQK